MNAENETPKTLTQTIEAQFNELDFTGIDGNSHYAAKDKDDLTWRNSTIDTFLAHDDLAEPDTFPTKHGQDLIGETAKKYDAMLDVLMAQPERTPEDDILIDRIINKVGELFRYEELMLAVGSTALGSLDRHRRLASEHSMELIGGINQPAKYDPTDPDQQAYVE